MLFRGEFLFLSNFDETPFWCPILGAKISSGEHGFNALKTLDPAQRENVLSQTSPLLAKRAGRRVDLRANWDEGIRLLAMKKVLAAKFEIGELAAKLLATGNLYLVESNTWHDNYWGDCVCGRAACSRVGANHLGILLMEKRSELGTLGEAFQE